MSNTLSELTCLGLRRPGMRASAAEVSDFYAELAEIHVHLAAESPTGADRERELALAAAARRHVVEVSAA